MQQIANIIGENVYYDGSRIFAWLADMCGLSVDLVNFLITQILALILASVFRSYLHPSKVSASTRHAIGLVIGLCFGYFCFGQQAIHIAALPTVCYIVIRTQNPQIVQRIVMVVALGYLSCIHLHRQYYDYGSYSLDITGPLMIITQKVTSLAFSIHDGFTRDEKEMSKSQQQHAIQKLPSALEFFSYTLHFQGLLAGPLVFYKDYIDFIEGYNILKKTTGSNGNIESTRKIIHEPSPVNAVVRKVISSLVCAVIFIKFATVYPIKTINDDDFINNTSIIYSFWYIILATTAVRFKYYYAWLMADAICNNSGLGFNGYDRDGTAKWDLISNIHVFSFEFGTNFRDCINVWNVGTNRWLRMVVYERVPKKFGTVLTFSLSALWHGFYPGYYITFATGALVVMAARQARKMFRYHFQDTAFKRILYDILTCITTRIFMGYSTFPFVILDFGASLRMYLKVFMCLHLLAIITIFILPKMLPREKSSCQANGQLVNGKEAKHGSISNGKIDHHVGNGFKHDNGGIHNAHKTEDNLSNLIKEKIELETRNIIDKTFTGIVELKDDLMRMNEGNDLFIQTDLLIRKRANGNLTNGNDSDGAFLKKEIDALNAAVQGNVLPAVLSNGHK